MIRTVSESEMRALGLTADDAAALGLVERDADSKRVWILRTADDVRRLVAASGRGGA